MGAFELALSQFAAKAGANADKAVRGVLLEFSSRVIYRSPVDTGRFRSNWIVSVDARDGTTTENVNHASAVGLDRIPVKAGGHVYYIQNNLPYAWSLEMGHSKQAPSPPGIVALTALEFQGIVDKSAAEAVSGSTPV